MFSKASDASCRLCGASLAPEEVYRLEVPFLERAFEVCRSCRDGWESGCRALARFEPRFRADRAYRWPRPLAEDALVLARSIAAELSVESAGVGATSVGPAAEGLRALEARDARRALARLGFEGAAGRAALEKAGELDLALALAAGALLGEDVAPLDLLARLVDRKARTERTPLLLGVYAHATAGAERAHLEAARSAYLLHLSYTLKDELDGRIASLHALASLDLGDQEGAAAKLRQYRRQADATPAARDPRIPLLQARLFLAEGNLAAVDGALETAQAWAKLHAKWAEVEAIAWFDLYVRATAAERWEPARDALKAYVKLRPDDRRALHDLGHAFMKCAADPVAREVLASYHAHDPSDEEGVVLYATCLARLGDTAEAWRLLRDFKEGETEEDLATPEARRLGAERRHLAGLVAHEEGDTDRALLLVGAAWALDRSDDDARENFVTLLLEEVGRRVDELTPETLPELLGFISEHRAPLEAEYGAVGLALLQGFVARELRDDFKTAPSFGIDYFGKVHFSDADLTTLQAYELLAKRMLGDAVRKDRQAQLAGGRPIPMDLLFRFLAKIKSWPEETRRSLRG